MPRKNPNGPLRFLTCLKDRRRAKLFVCSLCLIGLIVCGYKSRTCFFPKRFGVVVPGEIYRSGQLSRFLIESTLKRHGILHIVDLTGPDDVNPDQLAERNAARKLGIVHHRCPLSGDGSGDIEQYASALEVILRGQQAHEPVLVHCAAGSQRTGGVIAAYRLLFQGKSRHEVLHELAKYDWNPRKDRALLVYLVRRGFLTSPPTLPPNLSQPSPGDLVLADRADITH